MVYNNYFFLNIMALFFVLISYEFLIPEMPNILIPYPWTSTPCTIHLPNLVAFAKSGSVCSGLLSKLIFANVSTSSFVKVFVNVSLSPTFNDWDLEHIHLSEFLARKYAEYRLQRVRNPFACIARHNARETTPSVLSASLYTKMLCSLICLTIRLIHYYDILVRFGAFKIAKLLRHYFSNFTE